MIDIDSQVVATPADIDNANASPQIVVDDALAKVPEEVTDRKHPTAALPGDQSSPRALNPTNLLSTENVLPENEVTEPAAAAIPAEPAAAIPGN